MSVADEVAKIQGELDSLEAEGRTVVEIASVRVILDQLLAGSRIDIEHQKLKSQHELAGYDTKVKYGLAAVTAALDAGKEALNALMLVCGGAAVALLSFIGASAGKAGPLLAAVDRLPSALLHFGFGVLCGAIAFAIRYLNQLAVALENESLPNFLTPLAIVVGLAGYCMFGWGLWGAYEALVAAASVPHP